MNVIRETVRVVKEQIEKMMSTADKCPPSDSDWLGENKQLRGMILRFKESYDSIGRTIISEVLGGPWKQWHKGGKQ